MTGFMAQAGTILIGGDAGDALGDSLYEAVIYVAGHHRQPRRRRPGRRTHQADVTVVRDLAGTAGPDHIDPENVTRVASARELYHFTEQPHAAY